MVVIRELKPHETLEGLGLVGDAHVIEQQQHKSFIHSVIPDLQTPKVVDGANMPPSFRPKTAPSCRAVSSTCMHGLTSIFNAF